MPREREKKFGKTANLIQVEHGTEFYYFCCKKYICQIRYINPFIVKLLYMVYNSEWYKHVVNKLCCY